ncbi:MAG: hypothetical protein GTO31_12515, partial [Xanthomonadales bacterium]|nr:hypothetical protein [Xanthomonadales bacterium]
MSLRGAIVDVRRSIQRHITIGVSLGWQVFSEETRDAGAVGGAAARTLLRRHTNAFPLLASAHYRAGPP